MPATLNNCNSFSNLLHCSDLCLVYTLLKNFTPVDSGLKIAFGWCPDDAQNAKLISNILSAQLVWPVRSYLICNADQLTGFYMSVTLAWYGLNLQRKMMFRIFFKFLIRNRYKWAFIRLVAKSCRIFVGTANLQNICNLIGR